MNAATQSRRPLFSHARTWGLAALAVALHSGCGREFFREWANQDVSEAVFEKSRDPRWRIDLFSVDPPSSARYADPYDPDVPPAPPDDFATQALSPVPQWPDNRLLVPVEGTGYLDMLDAWQRQSPAGAGMGVGALRHRARPAQRPRTPARPLCPRRPSLRPMRPRRSDARGIPGQTGAEYRLDVYRDLYPRTRTYRNPAHPRPARASADLGVRRAAFQETGLPRPVPTPLPAPSSAPRGPSRELPTPPIGMDPNPTEPDLSAPISPRPDLSPEQYRTSEATGAEMAGILVPGASNSTRRRRRASPEPADLTC